MFGWGEKMWGANGAYFSELRAEVGGHLLRTPSWLPLSPYPSPRATHPLRPRGSLSEWDEEITGKIGTSRPRGALLGPLVKFRWPKFCRRYLSRRVSTNCLVGQFVRKLALLANSWKGNWKGKKIIASNRTSMWSAFMAFWFSIETGWCHTHQ